MRATRKRANASSLTGAGALRVLALVCATALAIVASAGYLAASVRAALALED
jgi:hypothetical protein